VSYASERQSTHPQAEGSGGHEGEGRKLAIARHRPYLDVPMLAGLSLARIGHSTKGLRQPLSDLHSDIALSVFFL
jgi:hypothetical protein